MPDRGAHASPLASHACFRTGGLTPPRSPELFQQPQQIGVLFIMTQQTQPSLSMQDRQSQQA
jgi:hypothetical protein